MADRDAYVNKTSIKYAAGFSDYIYLPGDFISTYNYYKRIFENANRSVYYSLYTFNCKHATLKGIMESKDKYIQKNMSIFRYAYLRLIPNDAFNYLDRKLNEALLMKK